jgi:hypothetical protein
VIRISDLQANQLVDCAGARAVASEWLSARWYGTEASFADTVAESSSGLGESGIVWRPGSTPPYVHVVCQPPPDADGAQPRVSFLWQAYTVCGAPTYVGGFWKAVEVNQITCSAGRAIVRAWIKKNFTTSGLGRKARRTVVGGYVCRGHFLAPRLEGGTFSVQCTKGGRLVRFLGSP